MVSKSIPYKYVVCKAEKKTYEFEFIYKLDSANRFTNRCLFVKPQCLADDGKVTFNWSISNYITAL